MSSRWLDRVRYTIRFRLAVWYAVLFLASSIGLLLLTYLLLSSSLQQRDHELIRSTVARYATEYRQGGVDQLKGEIIADQAAGRQERLFVRVLNAGEEAIFYTMPNDWRGFELSKLNVALAPGGEMWSRLSRPGDEAVLEVDSVRLLDGTLVQVGKSSESRAELLDRFRAISLGILTIMIVVGLGGGAILTHWTLQPVHNLIAAVRTIVRTGRVESRVPVRQTGDPLDELSVLFNEMLDRIAALIEGMRGSLDNVAHDLRTPMTRLRGIAENALQSGRSPDEYRDALADCLEEAERVVAMLNTLMDISEAETGTMRLEVTRVNVAGLLADAVELYADVADEKALTIQQRAPDDLFVAGDRNRLRQVVANLIDNAIKYTPRGGQIDLEAAREGSRAVLTVRDSGIGIPPDELPRVWDRLYRGDRSRSERGLGLGLSLVRAIVEAHKGHVEAASEPGRGSTFAIHLPLDQPGQSAPSHLSQM
jgi:signal transduction histidine kinase